PPVPTTSTKCGPPSTSTLLANSRMTCAAALISPIVSFFTRSPIRMAAIIVGDISPLMIWRMIFSISSWKISRCSMHRVSASCAVIVMSVLQEIAQQRVAVLGEDRFGVELHALDAQLAMAQAHDLAVVGPRGDLEAVGQRLALDRQRVVADRGERVGQPAKDADPRVVDRRGLAVHHLLRAHHLAAERRADRL